MKAEKEPPTYTVRRLHLEKTEQLDTLAHACGEVYTNTVVSFWRTVRKKGIWLKPKHMMRWINSDQLHAHTADACVQSFFAALASWRERRKADPTAHPPRRRKWYFRIEYKQSAMKLKEGKLSLSNGRGNDPLVLEWPYGLPQTLIIRWTGECYEAIGTYLHYGPVEATGAKIAGVDLGEIHMAVSHDGEHTHIVNGRFLRTKRQYRNKIQAKLGAQIDLKKKGSKRRKKLVKAKKKILKKLAHQIKDIEHKQTTHLISTLHRDGVQMVVIGDVRDIRQDMDVGRPVNQKLHQWSFGSVRFKLTYKARRQGMQVALQEERYTSRTCPACGHRKKSSPKGRNYVCQDCGYKGHRDGVGAMNIRYKYRGDFGVPHVVGAMAPPTGMRFRPHTRVARHAGLGTFLPEQREATGL